MPTKAAVVTADDIPDSEQVLYRVEQACAILGLSRSSMYREMAAGRIATLSIAGRQRRISRQAIIDYVERASTDPRA